MGALGIFGRQEAADPLAVVLTWIVGVVIVVAVAGFAYSLWAGRRS